MAKAKKKAAPKKAAKKAAPKKAPQPPPQEAPATTDVQPTPDMPASEESTPSES